MRNLLVAFLDDSSGATALEYSILALCIALILISAVGTTARHLNTIFRIVAVFSSHARVLH